MNYWEFNLKPVKYTDDVYYIGAAHAPAWLITTNDGLVMIDTSFPKTLYQTVEHIRELGFDPHDVKHIIHSHGHIDHIGGTRALVEMSGAKTYIGKGDADTVRGKNELQWTNEFGMAFEEPFEPDVIIEDGYELVVGEKKFVFLECPGHSPGALAIFFNCYDAGKELRAGMIGGAGINTLKKEYLDRYGLPYSLRDDFIASLDKMRSQKVDVHLGNHPSDSRHNQKLELVGKVANPFVDESSWTEFIDRRKAEALHLFDKDPL